jgi:hypothetical protein
MQWFRADLHLHTPGSADYQEPDTHYIDILRKAEARSLDIIAFTDHNTIAGYAAMLREIEQLEYLERLGRALPEEQRLLAEYRRLLEKILVLPGFEFTATFGFHILGIFAPATPIRQIEHFLLSLNVPVEAIEQGNSIVGASSDVLTAYRLIDEAGGICIAAHVNSAHGVAMRGFDFGGQTKIAYTQDRHLHALEVTDLGSRARGSTQRFFDGTKPEYPRRMRCIQGSDAHRINVLPTADKNAKNVNLGIGDRVTEVSLPERTFDALREMFLSADFSRSRPYNPARSKPYDYVQAARDEGENLVQSFHDSMTRRGGKLYGVVADICAFANTNGGTIYIGVSADKKAPPVGIEDSKDAIEKLQQEISRTITPNLYVEIDTQETQGKTVIRVQVPRGEQRPYAIEENKIYVRDETETSLAVRDEIVSLVLQSVESGQNTRLSSELPSETIETPRPAVEENSVSLVPRAGVEVISTEQRGDSQYHVLRDLRNGNIVQNVTRKSARRLWHYAITQAETNPVKFEQVQWRGEIGLVRKYQRAGETRYDLAHRENGKVRVYYGVTDNGMQGPWSAFLTPEEEEQA